MKKLLTITYTETKSGGVTYEVSKNTLYYLNGYELSKDIIGDICNRANDFIADFAPKRLLEKGLELKVYRIGNLLLAIDKFTFDNSRRWLNLLYGAFNTVNFTGEDYNFVIAVESKIIDLPIALNMNSNKTLIGLMESTIDINFINTLNKKKPVQCENFRNIIFKKSRLYVEKLYLPVKENIYFAETFCASPKISFYYRDKGLEAEKYPANMLVDKCELKTKSELSIELDNLIILDLCNLKYSSWSTRTKIDIKIKDGSNL